MSSRGLGGGPLGGSSPLFGGDGGSAAQPPAAAATIEEAPEPESLRPPVAGPTEVEMEKLRELLAEPDPERSVDDWGRSERVVSLFEPLLTFYYRYWFRVEAEGIENVPSSGGALLVSNHSGALPP